MSLYVDIQKQIGRFRLEVQFEAEDEVIGLLGASGCGKSMTLRCIAGLETPDQGIIIRNGQTLFDSKKGINLPARERKVGYLFQNYALFPNMNVTQNILSGSSKTKGILQRWNSERLNKEKRACDEWMSMFKLEGLENHYPHQLSGGQRQRVALARLLMSEPKLILLDEPFSALDYTLKNQLQEEIEKMCGHFNGTVVFVSHHEQEIQRLCEKVVVLHNGKSGKVRSKTELFKRPTTLQEARLIGCKNLVRAVKKEADTIEIKEWGICLKVLDPIPEDLSHITIYPHHIQLTKEKDAENIKLCTGVTWEEAPFSCRVITTSPKLYLEVGKDYKNQLKDPLKVRLPKEHLIMIRDDSLEKERNNQ